MRYDCNRKVNTCFLLEDDEETKTAPESNKSNENNEDNKEEPDNKEAEEEEGFTYTFISKFWIYKS